MTPLKAGKVFVFTVLLSSFIIILAIIDFLERI